ncbi:unnamed protein product, partial [Ectocarpus sp. 12 AP-2014]
MWSGKWKPEDMHVAHVSEIVYANTGTRQRTDQRIFQSTAGGRQRCHTAVVVGDAAEYVCDVGQGRLVPLVGYCTMVWMPTAARSLLFSMYATTKRKMGNPLP